ncbi:hypothetical protein AAFF_G00245220 [Aldrovandia affinis]|uniref:Kinesin-associated microtubule-binding domain-containing protein n=1 Tax=Aldrovandia affinis TaxID=143900 RepID=A0AAD7VVN7_9TELE|nr:hypothetical protein AAFF_G00245220 [Aldrovandia affinis]
MTHGLVSKLPGSQPPVISPLVSECLPCQDVEGSCDGRSQEAEGQLRQQQALFEGSLTALQRQTTADHTELHGHTVALSGHIDTSLAAVHSFLKEQLRRDVPTGGTPQRREYSYSKVLARTRSRSELLESFRLRQQQQELQESLTACDTITEEPEEQGPAEDELSSVEERSITQQSDAEEALMCSENGIPFFKRKHRGKKEGKTLKRSKIPENEKSSQSKMPLRVQN